MPWPPDSEQRRIAGILKEQMAEVEKARKATEAQLEAARALPAAYLREVFESEEAKKWPRRKLSDVCESIDYGHTAGADFTLSEPRFLRITDIQDGSVDWDSVPGCEMTMNDEEASRLRDGDIVFARTGATTGKSFLVRRPPRAVFASYLIRLRPALALRSDYLALYFRSAGYWRQISLGVRGGAQGGFNASMLGAIEVPVPHPDVQVRAAESLVDRMLVVEKAQQKIRDGLHEVDKLPAALLRRAFSGDI